ncbi:hypothetical protein LOK49_LG05G00297 [Camellia lanceoleosa]|uniref:Uncharacterized protein n=1 Tax=Camellia lanceoleosa TaxID=1840588 RepID=A0ACC0HKP0_9ERIC|nr:hypothetical protein LOK49_LG05G00297 [Camellia lanceoleosa]
MLATPFKLVSRVFGPMLMRLKRLSLLLFILTQQLLQLLTGAFLL